MSSSCLKEINLSVARYSFMVSVRRTVSKRFERAHIERFGDYLYPRFRFEKNSVKSNEGSGN